MDAYTIIGWAWIIFAIVWLAAAMTSKRSVRKQSVASRLRLIAVTVIAALFISGNNPWRNVLSRELVPRTDASADIGLALTLAGIAFAFWARFALGRNWSGTVTVKQDHELIQSGPYRFVRHPIYSGVLLALLGTVIARGELGAFIGFAIIVIALRVKSLTEEAFMTEQFGSRYTAYKQSVKALIPFVW